MAMTETEKRIYFEESMKRKTAKGKELEAENIRLQKLKNQFKRDLR
jgi:hypothetical protein